MSDIQDDPESDACGVDLTEEEADDEETAALRPLFPEGDASKESEWRELFPEPLPTGPADGGSDMS